MACKDESKAKVAEYIAKGRTANWFWSQLAQDVLKVEGIDLQGRDKEIGNRCERMLMSFYPTREKAWAEAWEGKTPEELGKEQQHVVELCMFEANFTLANVPKPPEPEKKEKKEKAEAAPAAPPAPPPPPPAG